MRAMPRCALTPLVLLLPSLALAQPLVLFDGTAPEAWDSSRDAARMAREYERHTLTARTDPVEGDCVAWEFRLREGGFADIFTAPAIPRPFASLRLRVRNRGAALSLAVKLRDAGGAEWTAPPAPLAAGADWQWVALPAEAFTVASWSSDPDGRLDFPCTPLAVIAFGVGPGHDYALDLARIEAVLPEPPVVRVHEATLPARARAGEEVAARLRLETAGVLLDDVARLGFQLDGTECFAVDLPLPAKPTALAAGTALDLEVPVRIPLFARGGEYRAVLHLGYARPEEDGADLSEGVARVNIEARKVGTVEARLEQHNGAPTIVVNGTPLSGMAYMAYGPSEGVFADFAREGVRLFSFAATPTESGYGLSRTAWTAPDTYDFSQLDERAMMVLKACPDAVFFPRIYVHAPPWWSREHPDDLVVQENADGTREVFLHAGGKPAPSWASEAWRQDTIRGIDRLIEHIEKSPYADRVIGYHIASGTTEEWMMWGANEEQWVDYSPANQRKFREWLRMRYADDQALRAAWADAGVTLETAEIPSRAERARCSVGYLRDPATEQRTIDFMEYNSWLVSDTIRVLARAVKERTHHERLVGVFYGYLLQLIGEPRMQNAGHLALNEVLSSPDVDFVTSPTSYMFRDVASGTSHFMSLLGSVKLHGKLWFDENDIRTSLAPGQVGEWGRTASIDGDILQQNRELGNVIANGVAQWWFDVGANRYDDPRLMAHLGTLRAAAERALDYDRTPVDEIAAIVDGRSLAYVQVGGRITSWLVGQQIPELARVGAPVAYYTLEDLRTLAPRRMYVFLTGFAPTAEQRAAVEALKSDGRVLVFVGPQGIYRDGRLEPEGMSDLTGIRLGLDRNAAPLACQWQGREYGTREALGPLGIADDPAAEVLGTLADGRPGLVRKRMDGWTAVHSTAPTLPAALLRSLAEEAGVHCYVPVGDVVWAGRETLSVWSPTEGPCPVELAAPATVVDLVTGETLAEGVTHLDVPIGPAGTRILGLRR
jgi:hypothetical protein